MMQPNKSDSKNDCSLLARLARAKAFRQCFPEPIKKLGRCFVPREEYSRQIWLAEDPYVNEPDISVYPAKVDVRLGIIKEFTHQHKYYISSCRKMGIPYQLVDISGPDWLDVIRNCECPAFLVWPSAHITVWKRMFDEKLKVITEKCGKLIYPSYDEIWFYESKRRMHYWLAAHNIPQPRTWVFYDRKQALQFARYTHLPIIYKVDLGSSSSGVRVFRKRRSLLRCVNRCFRKGFIRKGGDPRDRQWGVVLFQEYIPNAREWRMIRIGESFFGYEKVKKGDFASGSHEWSYGRPTDGILNFLKEVTDKGNFRSMDLDILVTPDEHYLVTEMQTVFGMGNPWEMCVIDGKAGRMLYEPTTKSWRFEEGRFCENFMCDLRVKHLLTIIK